MAPLLFRFAVATLFGLASGSTALAQSAKFPDLARIPIGSFQMGSDDGASWEQPVHRVQISAFSIAKRAVTNAEFRAFRAGHENPNNQPDNAPVTGVSWEDAQDYCGWLSEKTGQAFRLPTEGEWERAARGGLEQKKYPWGDEPPVPADKLENKDFRPEPRPNGFGLFAGSDGLWEWTADWYNADYYAESPIKDPKGPDQGEFRVLRGGGYRGDLNSIRCANRGSSRPKAISDIVTFRVVRAGDAPLQVTRAEPPRKPTTPKSPASPPRKPTGATDPGGPTALRDVAVRSESGTPVITLVVDPSVAYKTMSLSAPDRFVIDLPGARIRTARKRSIDVNSGGVKRVRWAQFKATPPVARVVLDLDQPMKFNIEAGTNELLLKPRR